MTLVAYGLKCLHQLMHKFFKRGIKIYTKTAATCFGVISILLLKTCASVGVKTLVM